MSLGLARGAPGLDALKGRISRHAFAGVFQVFPVARHHHLAKPALHGGVTLKKARTASHTTSLTEA